MNTLKRILLIALPIFLSFSSCKKIRNPKTEETPPPIEIYTYIPVKFETSTAGLTLTYKDNTTQLSEINDANGGKIRITYTEDERLFKLEKYRNGSLFNVVYYEQPDKKLTTAAQIFNYDAIGHNYTPVSSYKLIYDDQQRIRTINYFDNNIKPLNSYGMEYNNLGNLSRMTVTPNTGSANVIQYTFDQKKGISSQLSYSGMFTFESEHWFFLCSFNNILSITNPKSPQENASFRYEYNENGYPSKVILIKNNTEQTLKITYKRIDI